MQSNTDTATADELTASISTLEINVILQRNSLFYNQLISVPLIGIIFIHSKYLCVGSVVKWKNILVLL